MNFNSGDCWKGKWENKESEYKSYLKNIVQSKTVGENWV